MDFCRYVHLDSAAVSALNILPKTGININSPAYRWQSILGVLDRCRTPQGHRLMSQWVKQPLRNEALLKDRLDFVQCLVESPSTLTDLHDDHLKKIPDVMMLTRRLMRKKATLQDIFRLYQVVLRVPVLIKKLIDLENVTVNNVLSDPMKETLQVKISLNFDFSTNYFFISKFHRILKSLKKWLNKLSILKKLDVENI